MVDNIELSAGAGGAILAADDITSVWYPIGKIAFGALDTAVLAIAGAGAVTTGTQRVTLGSDDPAVTALQIMDDWDNGASDGASVSGDVAHDGADAGEPVKIGGYAKAAAPTAVSLDGDRVNAWFLLNGAQTVAITAAGALIPGDATNGLDVDVTRVTGTVTVANGGTFAVQIDAGAVTSLALIDDVVYAEDVAAQAADKGISVLAVRRDTPTALAGTDNDYIQLTTNATGHLWVAGPVTVVSGGIASGAVASGAIASGAVASGAYASGALAAGSIAAGAIADMIVDDAAFTPATSRVIMAGFEADETATDSVDEGDGGAARMTLDRKQIVTLQPHTAGGLTIFRSIDIDETEEEVKATAGQLYWLHVIQKTAAPLYLKFYNLTAANTTVGTSTPVLTLPVPSNADSDGSGFTVSIPQGLAFDTAISVACTTGVADADTGAPGANDCIINLGYK